MCGISFVVHSSKAASRSMKYRSLFSDMLLAGAVRGTDATGVFQVTNDRKVYYGKKALPSGQAVATPSIGAVIKDVDNSSISVGHVRASTTKGTGDANAHPFIANKPDGNNYIIGVHNGTLYGWETDDVNNEHEVDSSWAYSRIAERGIAAIEEFYGAFAFVWYDTESPDKLFIARNDERTLHIARSEDGKSIIGASEAGMLEWLAKRNDISISEVYAVDDGFLFSIDTSEEQLSIKLEEALPACAYYGIKRTSAVTAPSSLAPVPLEDTEAPPYVPEVNNTKLSLVAAVKECLRQARYSVIDDKNAEDDGPVEMGPTELVYRAKPEWFDTEAASVADMKRSLWDGSHGTIVMYEPVQYDQFNRSLVGEIMEPLAFKQPVAYLTNVEGFEADMLGTDPLPMVVVGVRYFNNEKEYIVAPLNEKGKKAIAA